MKKIQFIALATLLMLPTGVLLARTDIDTNVKTFLNTSVKPEKSLAGISVYAVYRSDSTSSGVVRTYKLETKTDVEGVYRFEGLVPNALYTVSTGFMSEDKTADRDGVITGKVTAEMLTPKKTQEKNPSFEKGKWDEDRLLRLRDLLKSEGLLAARVDGTTSVKLDDLKADIIRFQAKYGIPTTGFVGDLTTAKLNELLRGTLSWKMMNSFFGKLEVDGTVKADTRDDRDKEWIEKVREMSKNYKADGDLLGQACGELGYNSHKMECNEENNPELNRPNYSASNMPRVMFWEGKVNQHWDVKKHRFETDTDGKSSVMDPLVYCKKVYPKTTYVKLYKEEVSKSWAEEGNLNNYVYSMPSILCVE